MVFVKDDGALVMMAFDLLVVIDNAPEECFGVRIAHVCQIVHIGVAKIESDKRQHHCNQCGEQDIPFTMAGDGSQADAESGKQQANHGDGILQHHGNQCRVVGFGQIAEGAAESIFVHFMQKLFKGDQEGVALEHKGDVQHHQVQPQRIDAVVKKPDRRRGIGMPRFQP